MTAHTHRRAGGFTLLELLIALMVTGLVVALVFSAFGLIGRTEDRNQATMERAEKMLIASQWLARKFDGLRPVFRVQGMTASPFFAGNQAGAMWVAPLPERGDAGGLYVFRATPLRHDDGRVDLSLEVLPYTGALMALDWNQAEKAVLLDDLRTLQWHYQDGRTGQWTQQWDSATKQYPARVKLELADAQGAWPPLVFALTRAR